jgi:hypothetical protein
VFYFGFGARFEPKRFVVCERKRTEKPIKDGRCPAPATGILTSVITAVLSV